MKYIEKLQTMQGSAKNLENLSKEELIELVELLLKMSISQEKGYVYADELTQIVHKGEVESYQKALVDVVHANSVLLENVNRFELITTLKIDDDLINDLLDQEVKIVIEKGKGANNE